MLSLLSEVGYTLTMQITIIHHEPITGAHNSQSGGSIRLAHLCAGLQKRLPNVRLNFVCKATIEGNWKHHIHQHLSHCTPDIILCAQMEDVALLPARDTLPSIPVIVDLYAPRLLENLYETDDGTVSHHVLRAVSRSDAYLIAHHGQIEHWQAILRLMGIEEIDKRTLITPLGLEPSPTNPPNDLTLVGGGRVWPWQNPWDNLRRLLRVLDARDEGHILWFSPPDQSVPIEHERLTIQPWTSRTAYRSILSTATLGLDLNPPSPERRLACAFRHMEFLGCGLPILSANENILSTQHPKLCKSVDFNDEAAISSALDFTLAKTTLKRFQEAHLPANIVSELVNWLDNPTVRTIHRHWVADALGPIQQEFDATAKLVELEAQLQVLKSTHEHQTKLLDIATTEAQSSTASLLQVSKSLEQVSAFKNDIAHSWSDLMHQQQERIASLEEALRTSEANNAKKTAELHAMDLLRARLENDLQHVREQLNQQRKPRWKR